jgi:hypothetical protein
VQGEKPLPFLPMDIAGIEVGEVCETIDRDGKENDPGNGQLDPSEWDAEDLIFRLGTGKVKALGPQRTEFLPYSLSG